MWIFVPKKIPRWRVHTVSKPSAANDERKNERRSARTLPRGAGLVGAGAGLAGAGAGFADAGAGFADAGAGFAGAGAGLGGAGARRPLAEDMGLRLAAVP